MHQHYLLSISLAINRVAIPLHVPLVTGIFLTTFLFYWTYKPNRQPKAFIMPQLNTVVLKDAADVDHSFEPSGINGGVATLVNSTGVPIGDKTVSISSTRTTTGRRKVTMKMVMPIVQDVVSGGVSRPTVVRTAYADVTLTFDGTSTPTERDDLRAYLTHFLSEATLVTPIIHNLSSPF